jgi:hypothetical protein
MKVNLEVCSDGVFDRNWNRYPAQPTAKHRRDVDQIIIHSPQNIVIPPNNYLLTLFMRLSHKS